MLNRIVLMGRLTRDPELRSTPAGVSVCTVTLAVERAYARQGEQRETDFIDVVCWRQTAEFVTKYFRKGLLVAVEGRLQSRKWTDKYQQNRVTFEVVADSVYFAERTDTGAAASRPAASSGFDAIGAAATASGVSTTGWPEYNESGYEAIDDDIPF